MLNKQGGLASEEVIPIVVCVFMVFVAILIFSSCSASKIIREYQELKFSKEEIEAAKNLYIFLEQPFDEERTYSDLIVDCYFKNNYDKLEELGIKEYFSRIYLNWELYIDWGDDYEMSKYVEGSSGGVSTLTFTILPILKESRDIGFIEIAFITHYTEY